MDNATVLRNALGLIGVMDLGGIKGAQAPLVAETIAGLQRLIGEASGSVSPFAASDEIVGAGQEAVAL